MKNESSETLSSIQILRGIAAAMVLFFHLPNFMGVINSPAVLSSGVDLFFVISGFVIMTSTMHKRTDVGGFLWKRLVRVVPLYWVTTLVFALLWIVSGTREVHFDELTLSLLFIPYLDQVTGYVQPMLGVGWTLNLELCFYGLFAVSMFLRPRAQLVAITALFLALVALRVIMDPHEQSVLFFYTTPALLEFAAGMALALALPQVKALPKAAGLALLVAGVVALLVLDQAFALPRTLGQGVPALLIVAGAIAIEPYFRARLFAPLRTIGDASYALYLTHVIVLTVLRPSLAGWPWWAAGSIMVIACIATAVATYKLAERPLLQWARRVRAVQPQTAAT